MSHHRRLAAVPLVLSLYAVFLLVSDSPVTSDFLTFLSWPDVGDQK